MADFYLGEGRRDEAKKVLTEMSVEDPEYGPARRRLATIVLEEGEYDKSLEILAPALEFAGGKGPAEERGEGAHILRNGHVIVIENHNDVLVVMGIPGLVEALVSQAGGHRTISDYRNDLGTFALYFFGAGDSQSG